MLEGLRWLAVALSIVAASFGVIAAGIEIRDNADEFITDLRKQSLWSTTTALTAAAAAIVATLQAVFQP